MRQRIFESWTGRSVLLGVALLVFTTGYWVSAQQASPANPNTPAPSATAPEVVNLGREGKTVYVDISGFNRKNGAAEKMTKLHQEMAKQGFTFIGLDIYTENGDLQGFFCSYVRE